MTQDAQRISLGNPTKEGARSCLGTLPLALVGRDVCEGRCVNLVSVGISGGGGGQEWGREGQLEVITQ